MADISNLRQISLEQVRTGDRSDPAARGNLNLFISDANESPEAARKFSFNDFEALVGHFGTGSEVRSGPRDPGVDDGNNGDLWENESTHILWHKREGAWVKLAEVFTGVDDPNNTDPPGSVAGNLYVRTSNNTLWHKRTPADPADPEWINLFESLTIADATMTDAGKVRLADNLDDDGSIDVPTARQVRDGIAAAATSGPQGVQGRFQITLYHRAAHGAAAPSTPAAPTVDPTPPYRLSNIPADWELLANLSGYDSDNHDLWFSTVTFDPANPSAPLVMSEPIKYDGEAAGAGGGGQTAEQVQAAITARILDTALPESGGSTTNAASQRAVVAGLSGKADTSVLARVATSGSYDDLSEKPTIPVEYSLPNASTTVTGGVRIATGLDDTGTTDVTLASQVKAGLSGKAETSHTHGHGDITDFDREVDARVVSADNAATTEARGNVQLAVGAEAQAGTDATKAITPAALSQRQAITTRTGLIRTATDGETQAGTQRERAVTPGSLSSRTATTARTGLVKLATGLSETGNAVPTASQVKAEIDNISLTPGSQGPRGWSPVMSVATDGERRVLRQTDWVGGESPKPAIPTNNYVTAAGLGTLTEAINIRGAAGSDGTGSSAAFTIQAARPNNSQGGIGQLVYSTTESKFYFRVTAANNQSSSNTDWTEFRMGGTDGAATFLALTDTPSAFGTAGQIPAVNSARNALEFIDASAPVIATRNFVEADLTQVALDSKNGNSGIWIVTSQQSGTQGIPTANFADNTPNNDAPAAVGGRVHLPAGSILRLFPDAQTRLLFTPRLQFKSAAFDDATRVLTFTREDGTTQTLTIPGGADANTHPTFANQAVAEEFFRDAADGTEIVGTASYTPATHWDKAYQFGRNSFPSLPAAYYTANSITATTSGQHTSVQGISNEDRIHKVIWAGRLPTDGNQRAFISAAVTGESGTHGFFGTTGSAALNQNDGSALPANSFFVSRGMDADGFYIYSTVANQNGGNVVFTPGRYAEICFDYDPGGDDDQYASMVLRLYPGTTRSGTPTEIRAPNTHHGNHNDHPFDFSDLSIYTGADVDGVAVIGRDSQAPGDGSLTHAYNLTLLRQRLTRQFVGGLIAHTPGATADFVNLRSKNHWHGENRFDNLRDGDGNVFQGEQGVQGAYRIYIYRRENHGHSPAPATPTGGSVNPTTGAFTPPTSPVQWGSTIDAGFNAATHDLYESFATYNPATSSLGAWAAPRKIDAESAAGGGGLNQDEVNVRIRAHTGQTSDAGTFSTTRIPALPQSRITGLRTALAGKANTTHTHTHTAITDFDDEVGSIVSGRIDDLTLFELSPTTATLPLVDGSVAQSILLPTGVTAIVGDGGVDNIDPNQNMEGTVDGINAGGFTVTLAALREAAAQNPPAGMKVRDGVAGQNAGYYLTLAENRNGVEQVSFDYRNDDGTPLTSAGASLTDFQWPVRTQLGKIVAARIKDGINDRIDDSDIPVDPDAASTRNAPSQRAVNQILSSFNYNITDAPTSGQGNLPLTDALGPVVIPLPANAEIEQIADFVKLTGTVTDGGNEEDFTTTPTLRQIKAASDSRIVIREDGILGAHYLEWSESEQTLNYDYKRSGGFATTDTTKGLMTFKWPVLTNIGQQFVKQLALKLDKTAYVTLRNNRADADLVYEVVPPVPTYVAGTTTLALDASFDPDNAAALAWQTGDGLAGVLEVDLSVEASRTGVVFGPSYDLVTGTIRAKSGGGWEFLVTAETIEQGVSTDHIARIWALSAEQLTAYRALWTGDADIGDESLAAGPFASAAGASSVAAGPSASAAGASSVAAGPSASAAGDFSVAAGRFASAAGTFSVAAGRSASAAGASSVAAGPSASAAGASSVAAGPSASAAGDFSVAAGRFASAAGASSVAAGRSASAAGDYDIAEGYYSGSTFASSSLAMRGRYHSATAIPASDLTTGGKFDPAKVADGFVLIDPANIRQKRSGAWAVIGTGGGTSQDDPNLHFAWTRGEASGTTWADVFGLPYSFPAVPSFISTDGVTNLALTANLPSGYTLGTDGKLTIQSDLPLWAEFTESGIDYTAVKATFNVNRSGQHQDVAFWFGADGRLFNWTDWQSAGTTKGLAVASSLSTGRVLVYRAEDNNYLGSNGTWFSSLGSVGGPADFGSFTPVEGDNAFEIVYLNGRLIVRHNGAEVNSVNLPVANQPDISGGNHGVYLARVSAAGGSTAATLRLDAVAVEDPDLEDILGEEMNGGGGPGATSFFDLTDTDTAAIGRANPNEVLVYGPSGETVSSKSEGAVVQDAIAAAGVGQTAVDNRVKSDDNLAVPGSDTPGVVQVASVGDARARQPHDRGVVNVEGMDAALSGIPTGTQLSAAATDFHRKLGVEHTAGEIEYHGGFTKAWELTITDRPNRTGTFAGDTDGLTLTGGNIRGETAKQYGIWGFRAAGPLVTLNATLVQWTDTDSAGSNVGRIWISTNSAGRLLIHNPSDPTQSTLVASADRTSGFRFSTQDSLGFASQIAVEVLKLNPDDPTDDGIEFLPTAIRADGTVTQCNNIAFTSGWARFNTRAVHLFETAGTIPIDRVKFALHAGYESHAAFAAQLAGNADTAVAWGIRTAGAGRNTPDYTGNFDFKGTLKAYNDKDELQAVVLGDDARLGSGGGGGGGGSTRTTLLQDGTSRTYTVTNYANYKWLSVRVYNDNPNQARDSNANMHWDCVINTGLVETGQPLYSGGIGRGALNFAIRSTQSITGTNLELRVIDINVSDSAAGTFGIRRVVGDS